MSSIVPVDPHYKNPYLPSSESFRELNNKIEDNTENNTNLLEQTPSTIWNGPLNSGRFDLQPNSFLDFENLNIRLSVPFDLNERED